MPTALALGRARSDIDVMSRAGLPLHQFMEEASAAIERVIPCVATCLSTLDPATIVISDIRKHGALDGDTSGDVQWAQIEYGGDDPTAIRALYERGVAAVGMDAATQGSSDRSLRMAALMKPQYGFFDEVRVVCADRHGAWGSIHLFRGSDDDPFCQDEVDFLAEIAPAYTRGLRAGLISRRGGAEPDPAPGPAVVLIDAQDQITQVSPGATAQLDRIAASTPAGHRLMLVHSLVSTARRFARGEIDRMPRVRVRTADGAWLVLHASPLSGTDDRAGDVVVTIEEARPHEVIELVAAAYALTARERDVLARVLHGDDTKEIAASLHVSPYTVQDHLKSIFEKASVASRRELVARVFSDQYAPRFA